MHGQSIIPVVREYSRVFRERVGDYVRGFFTLVEYFYLYGIRARWCRIGHLKADLILSIVKSDAVDRCRAAIDQNGYAGELERQRKRGRNYGSADAGQVRTENR